MAADYIDRIAALSACPPAMEWLRTENHLDLATAWAACPRGDWMLWLAGRLAGPPGHPARIPLVLAACDCAELALVRVPVGEERPRRAIEAARAWARGEATAREVRMAAAAALSAAITPDAAPTAAATNAAGYAARYVGGIVTSSDSFFPDTTAVFAAASAETAAGAAATAAEAATSVLAPDVAASTAATLAAPTNALLHTTLSRCADIVRRYYPTPPMLE